MSCSNAVMVINALAVIWLMVTLRDHPESLYDYLQLTPFSQLTFDGAKNAGDETPLRRAANFFIRNRMSRDALGESFAPITKRLRRGRDEHVSAFHSAIDRIPLAALRLQFVRIEQMDANECIKKYDDTTTFFFVDPPYLPEVRVAGHHEVEMSTEQHRTLLRTLGDIMGKFMLCCYPSGMYAQAAEHYGWHHHDFKLTAKMSTKDPQSKRVERIYMNYDPNEQ